ncbi:hypothetical protein [Micromonospora sp. NPDC005707]|uniref:hypothetical protein n=1 Tax=Micromonospora sp. NPDC005707 TaxID=3157050 RepID=UPI0033C8F379
MGASEWRYVVAYQADVGAALQQLRQEVYDRGEYYREPVERDSDLDLTEEEFRARLDPRDDDDGFSEAIIEDWRERKRRPVPVDPDTLVAAQPHSGTHSIIDMINGRSDSPGFATVAPLTGEELIRAFGSTTPPSAQVQEWMRAGGGLRERWSGTYVISYRDGQPDHIHFSGYSGD